MQILVVVDTQLYQQLIQAALSDLQIEASMSPMAGRPCTRSGSTATIFCVWNCTCRI